MCEAWLPDISLVSQLSPWPADGVEYYFLKAKEIILPLFIIGAAHLPLFFFSLSLIELHLQFPLAFFLVSLFLLMSFGFPY